MSLFDYKSRHGCLWWLVIGSWLWMLYLIAIPFYLLYILIDKLAGDKLNSFVKYAIIFAVALMLILWRIFSAAAGNTSDKPLNTTKPIVTTEITATVETTHKVTDEPKTEAITKIPETTDTIIIETTTNNTTVPVVTTTTTVTTTPAPVVTEVTYLTYILNTNTMKFHSQYCWQVDKIKAENFDSFTGSRDAIIAKGYSPCGTCHP